MALPFSARVKLAMAYAEKKPLTLTPAPPLSPGEQVTSFTIAIASPDDHAPLTVAATRKADGYAVAFIDDKSGAVIESGLVPRHDAAFDTIDRIRLTAAKQPLPVQDGGLGDKLDTLLQA